MARETNTRELVRKIANETLMRGEKPTQAMIRRVILEEHGRVASPNVVMAELNAVMVDSAGINAKRYALPGLPAEVSESFAAIWTLACEHANTFVVDKMRRAEEREHAAEQTVLAMSHELAIQKTTLTGMQHDLDLVNQSSEQKSMLIAELQNAAQESRLKLDALIERNNDMLADKIRAEASTAMRVTEIEANNRLEVARVRSEHEMMHEKMIAAHAQEAEAWDGLRRHLLQQTDQIRQISKERDESQRGQLANLEMRENMLTHKANEAQDALSRLRGVIETLESQIVKMTAEEKLARSNEMSDAFAARDYSTAINQWLGETAPDVHNAFIEKFGNGF